MADLEGRIKVETERYMALLERLGHKLCASLDVDVTSKGTPTRDWMRAFANYSTGMRGMLEEQRERLKLRLAAGAAGQVTLSDEEYAQEMRQLAIDAVHELPERELREELERRGVRVATEDDGSD